MFVKTRALTESFKEGLGYSYEWKRELSSLGQTLIPSQYRPKEELQRKVTEKAFGIYCSRADRLFLCFL